jgi:hypothetical protein
MKFELAPDETKIGSWTLFYFPPNGGKYNGTLVVTNKRLLYDAKFDASIKGMVTEALFIKWGSEGYLTIAKSDIQKVDVEKKLLSKKCILTLADGSKHTFDSGALGIDKVVAAVEAR